MAIITVGDLSIDLLQPQLNLFPAVTIPSGRARLFGLSTIPNPVPLADNGYFLVIPVFQFPNTSVERPSLTKWFPKNRVFNFKCGVFDDLAATIGVSIALYPIIPFGRFVGGSVDVRLLLEDSTDEPAVIGV